MIIEVSQADRLVNPDNALSYYLVSLGMMAKQCLSVRIDRANSINDSFIFTLFDNYLPKTSF